MQVLKIQLPSTLKFSNMQKNAPHPHKACLCSKKEVFVYKKNNVELSVSSDCHVGWCFCCLEFEGGC